MSEPFGRAHRLVTALLLAVMVVLPNAAFALTVGEVAKDLACPCECPLILEDCNMTCGLDWKEEIGEMVKAGKTKQEIMAYFIATYGEEARLTTLQKVEGKIYQYTRGFGTTDWVILWAGVGFWALILMGGIYYGVRRFVSRAPV
ncbi:MAG: cytochrome c-type biogenesis protein [Alphaproteobacteria bacterium]